MTRLSDINNIDIYKKWRHFSFMFECFVHSTSFATLKNYPDFELITVPYELTGQSESIIKLVTKHLSKSALFFIDLPVPKALAYVCLLNEKAKLLPVLTTRHINHEHGLVGDKNIISCLIQYSSIINVNSPEGFIFVLDSQRYSVFDDNIYKTHFNNQYEITEYDVPPIEMLKEFGYSKAVFIYEESLKEDINEYKEYLVKSDFDIICYNMLTDEEITNG
jgi:hypothetical protein